MSLLASLPSDITILSLLPFIPPEDFDSFCYSSPHLQSWCADPKNIHDYLFRHNVSSSDTDEGLLWPLRNHSKVLQDYFLCLGANMYNTIMAEAAELGNMDALESMILEYGANNYNLAMAYGALGGQVDTVIIMSNMGARDYNKALNYAERAGHTNVINVLKSLRSTYA